MSETLALLTNGAWWPRERKPTVLACLHQTSNTATAAQERSYANRAGSPGPSATVYVDRDGTVIRALRPADAEAWSQGDVRRPRLDIPTVAAMAHSGTNPNRLVWESVECCGQGSEPYTEAQFAAVAQLVADAHRATGLPIDRSTVLVHADLNSIDRASDPWPASTREARVARVIADATALTGDAMSVLTITVLPFGGGTVSFPPGVPVTGLRLDASGHVAARVPFTADADGSSAHADATADLSQLGIRGGPFVRVADGVLAGCYLGATGVTFHPNAAPPDTTPFTQADVDAARSSGYATAKANAAKAVGGI